MAGKEYPQVSVTSENGVNHFNKLKALIAERLGKSTTKITGEEVMQETYEIVKKEVEK